MSRLGILNGYNPVIDVLPCGCIISDKKSSGVIVVGIGNQNMPLVIKGQYCILISHYTTTYNINIFIFIAIASSDCSHKILGTGIGTACCVYLVTPQDITIRTIFDEKRHLSRRAYVVYCSIMCAVPIYMDGILVQFSSSTIVKGQHYVTRNIHIVFLIE